MINNRTDASKTEVNLLIRKEAMPFLTVDAIIGNQAFQNGRCHICFSLGLDRVETAYNLLME